MRTKRKSLFELPSFSDSDDSSLCEFETKPTSTPRPLGLTERQRLIIDQDTEYQASLEADREKKVRKEESERLEEEEKNRMEELRVLRKERAPEEPDLSEPHSSVSIRCVSGEDKYRLFSSENLFTAVYDWVSLSFARAFCTAKHLQQ